MSIETIIAICVPVVTLVIAVVTFNKNFKKDNESDASERATMSANIQYIRESIDDIKLDNREIKGNVTDLQTRVAKVEQSVESAHKRIDDIKKG